MKLELRREHGSKKYTLGDLYIDGEYFCKTLEDEERDVKIKGETSIPVGTYEVIVTYSNRFNQLMPLLLNVPNFEGIRIHSGNTDKDTDGCILVGKPLRADFIQQSRDTYVQLMKKINAARPKGKIWIEIT